MDFRKIRVLREARNITQEQLSDASQISVRTIRDLENGKNKSPSYHVIQNLGKFFFPNNFDDFFAALEDDPDFSTERDIFECSKKHIPTPLYYWIDRLLDFSVPNAVSQTMGVVCTYLASSPCAANTPAQTYPLLNAFAGSLRSTSEITNCKLLEEYTQSLLVECTEISHLLSEKKACEILSLVERLNTCRSAVPPQDRSVVTREIFFLIYGEWRSLCQNELAYLILKDIFSILDRADSNEASRRTLFSAIIEHFEAAHTQKTLQTAWAWAKRNLL